MNVVERYKEIHSTKVGGFLNPSYDFYESIIENEDLTFAEWVEHEAIIAKNTMRKKDLFKWADSVDGQEAVNDYFCEVSCIKPVHFNLVNFLRDALQYKVREDLHEHIATIVEHTLIRVLYAKGFTEIEDTDFEEMRLAVLQERSSVVYGDFEQVVKEYMEEKE